MEFLAQYLKFNLKSCLTLLCHDVMSLSLEEFCELDCFSVLESETYII